MCGIAGTWASPSIVDPSVLVQSMTDALAHRGPDAAGIWQSDDNQLVLGHRRLAIIDPSPTGAQPMLSHCGRYTITYNGELYNHLEVRAMLEAENSSIQWRGTSDTETLLVAIMAWGFKESLVRFRGMFAIALYDKQLKQLSMARDRLGEKPLYYGWIDGSFVFASELKPIKLFPGFRNEINRSALAQYMETSSIASPLSIYQDIYKLPPGSMVVINDPLEAQNQTLKIETYWQLPVENAGGTEVTSDEEMKVYKAQLDAHLKTAVKNQLISDVPFGAFLSGGYDSSLVVALMQQVSSLKARTFSIGFEEEAYNEAHHARAVANHLGTEHTELIVSADDAIKLVARLPKIWDEPFADPSQIPTVLVSAMTREHVTVSLSGDGGDELFCGYTRYQKTLEIWSKLSRFPTPLRLVAGKILGWSTSALTVINNASVKSVGLAGHLAKLVRLRFLFESASTQQLYTRLMQTSEYSSELVKAQSHKPKYLNAFSDDLHAMMYEDIHGYLPNTILAKVDRASMSVSLEARAPLLDHKLVEFAWSLPLDMKLRNGIGKWLLKEVLHDYVPKTIMDRPKTGFGIPLSEWLRGPLKSWAEQLLNENKLREQGYLQVDTVLTLWKAHQDLSWDHGRQLWNILMFQAWLEENA